MSGAGEKHDSRPAQESRALKVLLYTVFSASLFTLALALASPLRLVLVSSTGIQALELPRVYTLSETVIIACSSCAATASAMLLLILPGKPGASTGAPSSSTAQAPTKNIGELLESLDENEKRIVETLLRNGGSMYQSDLARELDMPKSTLSTILHRLEQKGVVLRVSRGFKNLVVLRNQAQPASNKED